MYVFVNIVFLLIEKYPIQCFVVTFYLNAIYVYNYILVRFSIRRNIILPLYLIFTIITIPVNGRVSASEKYEMRTHLHANEHLSMSMSICDGIHRRLLTFALDSNHPSVYHGRHMHFCIRCSLTNYIMC